MMIARRIAMIGAAVRRSLGSVPGPAKFGTTPRPATDAAAGGGLLSGGVLITIHRLSQGGADRVAILLANGLAAAGIPTRIALLRGGGEGERALLDILHADVTVSSAGPAMGSRHLELVRGFRFIRREAASANPSIILASSSNMGLVTGLTARLRRHRSSNHVMKLTNPVIRPSDRGIIRSFYRRRLYSFIFGSYDRVLILTHEEHATLATMFPQHRGRFETAANPYVTAAMLADYPAHLKSDPGNILTLARMMPQKRLDHLLRSFARISHTKSRLTILGDGPERPKLERLVRSLGIAERVEMPGFVEDVVPWLRRADLFVLSSDYEGLPAAALEALAGNVPVVTTDCFEGARSLLAAADHCAVVPRGDIAAFAAAMDASLAAKGAPSGLRNIAREYSVEAAIAAHLDSFAPFLKTSHAIARGKA